MSRRDAPGLRDRDETTAAAGQPLVELLNVSKSFGAVQALRGASLDVYPGEVHALLGENGAGKSTLMNVLAGVVEADAGTIHVRGQPATIRARRDGARYGIGYVQQHFSLVEELTVAQNFMLGHPDTPRLLRPDATRAALSDLSQRLGIPVEADALIADLSIGERQRLEILIALSWGARVVLLDEPTAATGPAEFSLLADVIHRLRDDGAAVVYVSHKIPEIEALADRVTVLRHGEVVGRHAGPVPPREQLVAEMVGHVPETPHPEPHAPGEAVVVLRQVSTAAGRSHPLHGVDLTVHRHEILGVAGVAANGQEDLAAVLCGLLKPTAGTLAVRPERCAYIPEDRARDGLALDLPIPDNAIVHAHRDPELQQAGWLRPAAVRSFTERVLAAFSVTARPNAAAMVLSGGNQQRLVLGRELVEHPDLVVAHNPTRGLDVAATLDVQRRLLDARVSAAGVVLISPDLDELLNLSDRVVVLYGGAIAGEVPPGPSRRTEVVALMTGGTQR